MKMDIHVVSLLLVMAVRCQCLDIGIGRTQTVVVAPNLPKAYQYFSDVRYNHQDNQIIKDINYKSYPFDINECVSECHQHNQRSDRKCVAVNFCHRQKDCHLLSYKPGIKLRSSYPRCILLSAGLRPGVNGDQLAEPNANWIHFVDHDHYQRLVHNGGTCKLKISEQITKEYLFYFGGVYIPGTGDIIIEINDPHVPLEHCLLECHQHNQNNQEKCVAVNYCERTKNCKLVSDGGHTIIAAHKARCILLKSGIRPGLNENHLVPKKDNWEHFFDNDFYGISVDDFKID